jgi:hypothetical protein
MTAIRKILASVTALALLCSPAAHAVTPRQKQRIDAMAKVLDAEGPRKALERYFHLKDPADGPKGGSGYALVETGDPTAIRVGVAVLAESDGGVSESLHSSLAVALAKNPTAVLSYYSQIPPGNRQNICVPFISADDPNGDAQAKAALARAERALKSVHDPALAAGKAACLEEVRDYRAAMRQNAEADAAR